jgi:hypothetical protein
MDNRSKEQFAEDIQKSSRVEREIIDRFVEQYKRENDVILLVQDSGCDNSGKFLTGSKVTTKADFIISGIPVEVKFNNQKLKKFHLKTYHLESYIQQGAWILWVNGYETKTPEFTFFKPEDLVWVRDCCPVVHFFPWSKECYQIESKEFKWMLLKPLERRGKNG